MIRAIKDFFRRLFGMETHAEMLARKRLTRWRRIYTGGPNQGSQRYGSAPRWIKRRRRHSRPK